MAALKSMYVFILCTTNINIGCVDIIRSLQLSFSQFNTRGII